MKATVSYHLDSWRRLKLLSKKSNYIHNRELTVCSSWACAQGAARGRTLAPSRFKSARRSVWVYRVMSQLPDNKSCTEDRRKTGSKWTAPICYVVLATETINGVLWVVLGVLWQLGAHVLANGFLALSPACCIIVSYTFPCISSFLAIPKPDACFFFD